MLPRAVLWPPRAKINLPAAISSYPENFTPTAASSPNSRLRYYRLGWSEVFREWGRAERRRCVDDPLPTGRAA